MELYAVCVLMPMEARKESGIPGAGVSGGCELPEMDAGNQTV